MFDPTLPSQSKRIAWLLETQGHCQIFGLGTGGSIIAGSALSGVSSLAGGKKQAGAATQAAQIQANAALAAAALQQQRFEESKGLLMPFVNYGTNAIPTVQALTGTGPGGNPLTAPLTQLPGTWAPTMEQLQNMPGYQFQLQQGLQAGQANLAASGLGRSGAGMQQAENIASGLAGSNWMQNFQQWLNQQNLSMAGRAQSYNMLTGQVGTGLSAAGATAGVGTQAAAQVGNALQAAGASTASGVVGASNALTSGLTGAGGSIASGISNAALLSALQNPSADAITPTSPASAVTYGGNPVLPPNY